jgi:LTR polyprotein gag-polypeptide-like protein
MIRLYDVPHLEDDGSNYASWKYHVQMDLNLRNLWGVVDGTEAKPEPSASHEERKKWGRNDLEARAQITLTLKDEPLSLVLDATTAKECWDKLLLHYDRRAEQEINLLIEKIFRNTLSDAEPLEPQINAVIRAARTITNLGLQLDDKLVASAIISSLPPSLFTLQTILLTSSPSDLSPAYVLSQVILDEQRRIYESGIGAAAFFAKAAKKTKAKERREQRSGAPIARTEGTT